MLVNTQYFRQPALYFEKHGKYDCGEKGTGGYERWWNQQKERCLYGYTVGGMWIPGLFYSYLNFNKIEVKIKTGKRSSITTTEFPKFWDVDYVFFMSVIIAKNGIINSNGDICNTYEECLKEYNKYPISLGLKLDEDNISGGKHLFWQKPRGVGASWKAASIASRNFHHVEKSKTFMLADNEQFLNKDGLFSKFIFLREFLNKHTEFKASSFSTNMKDMHLVSGFDNGNRTNGGLASEVMGVSVAGDPDKVRGKRGEYLLWEEFGNFRKVPKCWEILKMSQEEGGLQYGTSVAFGTGGTESEAADHMEEFALNPRANDLLAFDNIWDKDLEGTDCTLFTPASSNIQFTDENGNSSTEKAMVWINAEYDKARESKDAMKLQRRKAEIPLNILDSLMSISQNKFAIPGFETWKNKAKGDAFVSKMAIPKTLIRKDNGTIEALFNPELKPVIKYPHRKEDDITGCVVEYAIPYVDESGKVPEHLYFICCDPYAEDDAEDVTSLGAAYVMMNFNNVVPNDVGDRIVASFVGRRRTTSEFSDILFMLSERWNAPICIEQERGTIVDDAKLRNKTHLLVKELSLTYDEQITTKKVSNLRYGTKISSGKFNTKMLVGDTYIVNWMQRERETSLNGIIHNFNLMYDVGLLEELSKYKQGQGNYDRISALRIGMFYSKELIHNNKVAKKINPHEKGKFTKFREKYRN